MVVAAVSTLVVGAFPALRLAWVANGLVDLALGAYLVGLRRLRLLAIERQAKVRYLRATEVGQPAEDLRRPASSSIG